MADEPQITITDCLHAFALAGDYTPDGEKDVRKIIGFQQGIAMSLLDWAAQEASDQRARFDMENAEQSKIEALPDDPKRK